MTDKKRNTILLIGALVVLTAVFFVRVLPKIIQSSRTAEIKTFSDCAEAGYPVMESYPRQCRTPDGRNFVESIATRTPDWSDLIVVDSPKPGDTVTSPIIVKGKARGSWYFEASFPVKLLDKNGIVVAQVPAQAKSDWMTSEFVPFEARLTFSVTKAVEGPAELVLKNDNPSGIPEKDKSISLPVIIKGQTSQTQAGCVKSGCSAEICSDSPEITPCIYRVEYACYKTATCERQADGQCGWTDTPALAECLRNVKSTAN